MTNTKFHQMPIMPKQANKPVVKESTFVTTTGTEEINWYHTILLAVTPLLSLYGLLFVRPAWQTVVVGVIFYYWSGIGITGGYHRLWSHRSYKASFAWRLFLIIGGSLRFRVLPNGGAEITGLITDTQTQTRILTTQREVSSMHI